MSWLSSTATVDPSRLCFNYKRVSAKPVSLLRTGKVENAIKGGKFQRRWKCLAPSANLLPLNGRLAQLVEHCVHTAGVTGSSPVAPT